jgi:WD40 repeat protein
MLNTVELQSPAKSCDFSPNGKYLAVGYDNGVFEVF